MSKESLNEKIIVAVHNTISDLAGTNDEKDDGSFLSTFAWSFLFVIIIVSLFRYFFIDSNFIDNLTESLKSV